MKTETTNTISILDESFEMPVCNADLQELIESSIDNYNAMPSCRKETRDFKRKINELIDELNNRRDFRAYKHI